ncbi:hypothetical protein AVEN_106561-1 [Araneus ventricosus]|uniref:Uncharacterized protein n=1 Tax=Araneus ventricosus TaxID=182803 RepID=A0A4Y2T3Q6_ARAVE|nr:hypothetical protein AVEN_106561-1 [Araneus ventricosus]
MCRKALKKMIAKFEETEELGELKRREWKRLSNESAEEVALVVVERVSVSQYSSTSARTLSRDLSLPWSRVRNILRSTVKWYPYKIQVVQTLNADPDKRIQFCRMFLARIAVYNSWP